MFHWICPECGQEIAPTARECPACDPNAVAAEPALMGVVEPPSARHTDEAAPTARHLSGEAPTARQANEPALSARPVSDATPPAESGKSATEPLLPQLGNPATPDDPLGVLAATLDLPALAIQSQRTAPDDSHCVPQVLRALIAELGPVASPARHPSGERLHMKPATEPPAAREAVALTRPSAANIVSKPFGAKLLPREQVLAVPAAPGTPSLGLAPALAPLAHYNPLEGHPLRPAQPTGDPRKPDCGLRLTLAGPALIKPLLHFADEALNPIPVAAATKLRKPASQRWLTVAVIIGAGMAAGLNGLFSGAMRPAADAKPPAAEAAPSVPAPPANTASPLSKAIEVTGFRIQMDPEKKPEIRYLVVNHTANSIAGVTVYVTLHTATEPPGQAPLAKFQFAAPNLGSYQSKEMASAIERVTRPIDAPDWQDLRADIEVGQ